MKDPKRDQYCLGREQNQSLNKTLPPCLAWGSEAGAERHKHGHTEAVLVVALRFSSTLAGDVNAGPSVSL